MILLTIHLVFVHFSAEMITFTYVIFRYGQYNDLFLFFDCFRIHKCYFSVITFAKLSGHAETSVALLQDKFSINYTTIPFNQVPCHRCYSNKSISYFFLGQQIRTFPIGFVCYGSRKEDIDLLESTIHVVIGYALIFCTILSFEELCSR